MNSQVTDPPVNNDGTLGTHPTRHGKHPRPELADASPPDTPHELDRYASATLPPRETR